MRKCKKIDFNNSKYLKTQLLMAEAFKRNIIFPNKKKENFERFHQGHLLDNETYIGGRVEGLTSGVYRSDLPTMFHLEPKAYKELISKLDHVINFSLKKKIVF